jgi:hypothetical protein
VLRINHHGLAAGEFHKIDAASFMSKLQFDSLMDESQPHYSSANARFVEQIHRALLENTRAYALDSLQVQKVGE